MRGLCRVLMPCVRANAAHKVWRREPQIQDFVFFIEFHVFNGTARSVCVDKLCLYFTAAPAAVPRRMVLGGFKASQQLRKITPRSRFR